MKYLKKNNRKSHGFILVTTMIFILLLSLLAYQALESALLEIKLQQVVKNKKFLFDQAQKNLESSEKDLKNHCSLYDQKNANNCSVVQSIEDEKFDITSTASIGDMTVKVRSTCIKSEIPTRCSKRLSWEQLNL